MSTAAMETRYPRASDYTPEQRARNFVRPFLRDGYRLHFDVATGCTALVPGRDGQEVAPVWAQEMERHSPALARIRQQQRERKAVTR